MAYENKTYEAIKEAMLNRITGIDKREGSFTSNLVSPIALELESYYHELNKLLGVMFLEDSAGEYIDKKAGEYGLKRKQGTSAIGYVVFTGNANTFIPKGTLVGTNSNMLYETTEDAEILSEQTTVSVAIKAQEIGSRYNVPGGVVNKLPVSIVGISAVINGEDLQGGTDIEVDQALVERLLLQIQNPATSGNAMHYKLWALEVNGVGNAKVFPLWNGPGTVRVIPITTDKRAPDSVIIQNVYDYIESKRPIGSSVTVDYPIEISINVEATLRLNGSYTLENIVEEYATVFNQYIKNNVFKLYTIDFYKCLSMCYEIAGVEQVIDFKLNNGTANIVLADTEIQVPGTLNIAEEGE